jgi:hypothetical protein
MATIEPTTLMNQTISGVTPVSSNYLDNRQNSLSHFMISVGSGLTASFSLQVSLDNVTFGDSGIGIPNASGTSVNLPVFIANSFPYIKIVVTPTAGSGTVIIKGASKLWS